MNGAAPAAMDWLPVAVFSGLALATGFVLGLLRAYHSFTDTAQARERRERRQAELAICAAEHGHPIALRATRNALALRLLVLALLGAGALDRLPGLVAMAAVATVGATGALLLVRHWRRGREEAAAFRRRREWVERKIASQLALRQTGRRRSGVERAPKVVQLRRR